MRLPASLSAKRASTPRTPTSASFEVLAALRSDGRLFLVEGAAADDWASALEEATEGGADEVAALAGDDAEGPAALDAGEGLRADPSGVAATGRRGGGASAVRSLAFAGRSGALLAVVSGSCSPPKPGQRRRRLPRADLRRRRGPHRELHRQHPRQRMEGGAAAGLFERTSAPVLAAADAGGDAVLVQLDGGELLLWSAGTAGFLSGCLLSRRLRVLPGPVPLDEAAPSRRR